MEWKGKMCLQNGYIKHNLIAALGLGGWHGLSRFLSHPQPTPHPTSVLSSSGENSGLWENSKMSVFSKRPLPSFPCSSIHPTINLLVFPTVPNCVHCKEKWQVIWGQIKGKMRAGGHERWRNENWRQKKNKTCSACLMHEIHYWCWSEGNRGWIWEQKELEGEESVKKWISWRNEEQIEKQWIGVSVPDMTHVRNSAAHICTIYWWETNGAERHSRKADVGRNNRALWEF